MIVVLIIILILSHCSICQYQCVVSKRGHIHSDLTTTGGTVLSGSLTGPGGVNIINFSPVGTRNYRGQDNYRASTGTRTGGSDGDTYQCTTTNGVPAPDGSGSTTLRGTVKHTQVVIVGIDYKYIYIAVNDSIKTNTLHCFIV